MLVVCAQRSMVYSNEDQWLLVSEVWSLLKHTKTQVLQRCLFFPSLVHSALSFCPAATDPFLASVFHPLCASSFLQILP